MYVNDIAHLNLQLMMICVDEWKIVPVLTVDTARRPQTTGIVLLLTVVDNYRRDVHRTPAGSRRNRFVVTTVIIVVVIRQ